MQSCIMCAVRSMGTGQGITHTHCALHPPWPRFYIRHRTSSNSAVSNRCWTQYCRCCSLPLRCSSRGKACDASHRKAMGNSPAVYCGLTSHTSFMRSTWIFVGLAPNRLDLLRHSLLESGHAEARTLNGVCNTRIGCQATAFSRRPDIP